MIFVHETSLLPAALNFCSMPRSPSVMNPIRSVFILLAGAMAVLAFGAEQRLLEGTKLHCCTIVEYPIVSPDKFEKYKYKGLAFDYLKELESRLGFSCASMYEYKSNGTSFTKFTKDMERCTAARNSTHPLCRCELGVGGWLSTRERVGRVRFVSSFLRLDTDILTHVDNTGGVTSGAFFVAAFTPTVWALIALLFWLFTIVRMMDTRFEMPSRDYEPLPEYHGVLERTKHFLLKSSLLYRLRKAACRTAMEMTQQVEPNAGMRRNSMRQWVLTFGIMLAGLFFVLTYEAFMTAQLVDVQQTSVYRTADDLRKCHINVNEICIPEGGAEESYWRNSFAHEPCSNGQMPKLIDSYDHVIEMVAHKKCKYVMSGNAQSGEAMSGKHCASVVKVGKPVFWGGVSYVMPTNANWTIFKNLRDTTIDLVEQGRLMSLAEYYEQKGECFRKSNSSLTFPSLQVFFFVAFSFIFVMFVVMVLDPQRESEEKREEDVEPPDPNVILDHKNGTKKRSCDISSDGSEFTCDLV